MTVFLTVFSSLPQLHPQPSRLHRKSVFQFLRQVKRDTHGEFPCQVLLITLSSAD
jgi:hypothetical protein